MDFDENQFDDSDLVATSDEYTKCKCLHVAMSKIFHLGL